MTERNRALVAMLVAQFLFSLMALGVRMASLAHADATGQTLNPWVAVLVRGVLALPIVVLLVFLDCRRDPSLAPAMRKSAGWLAVRGLMGTLGVAAYFYACIHIPVGVASVCSQTSAFFTGLLAHFFLKERLTRSRALFSLVGLAGVAVIVLKGGVSSFAKGSPADYLIALLSGLLSGIALFSIRRMKHLSSNAIFGAHMLAGALLPLGMLAWEPGAFAASGKVLGWLACAAIPAVVAQLLMTWAFRHAQAALVAAVQYTGPLFTLALGFLLFDERLGPLEFLGCALVVTSGVIFPFLTGRAARLSRRHPRAEPGASS